MRRAAATVAEPLDGTGRTWTTLKYRPNPRPVFAFSDDMCIDTATNARRCHGSWTRRGPANADRAPQPH